MSPPEAKIKKKNGCGKTGTLLLCWWEYDNLEDFYEVRYIHIL